MTHRINFIEDGVERHDNETKIEINSIKVKLGIFDNNKVDKKDYDSIKEKTKELKSIVDHIYNDTKKVNQIFEVKDIVEKIKQDFNNYESMNRITVSKIKNDINHNAETSKTRVDAIFKSLDEEIKKVSD